MSTRIALLALAATLVVGASSCLTVSTRVNVTHPGGGDVCSEEPGRIPCDRDCNSFADCEKPNNCCRGLCDAYQEE